jgi:cytochrome c-type biogenesis protein CcmH
MPRFFLAAAMSQDGRFEEATAAWRALLADLPADSPWRPDVEQALADVAKHVAGTSEPSTSQPPANEPSALPAPSEEEVDAAASMSDADRTAMIESMVANLDEKLKQNPKDVEGWHRLLRSYMVLDRRDEAAAALERGVAALGEGSAEAKALVEFASGLGLTRTE